LHTDWRPRGHEWFGVDPTYAVMLAEDYFLITLD
jgi:hypothetical protein